MYQSKLECQNHVYCITLGWRNRNVQSTPCMSSRDTVIYATRYDHDNQQWSGIFEYNVQNHQHQTIKLWKDTKYHPRWNTMVYSKIYDKIIFAGGVDIQDELATDDNWDLNDYKTMMIYHLKGDIIQYIDLNHAIGKNPKMVLTHNEEYLHIIGGDMNNKHIVFNLITNQFKFCSTRIQPNRVIQEQGFIYHKKYNKIMMFGGLYFEENEVGVVIDDFFMLDLNKELYILSNDEWCEYLVMRFMNTYFVTKESSYHRILNPLIKSYIGAPWFSYWNKCEKFKLPQKIRGCGAVIYKERFLIIFGGRDDVNRDYCDIYYLDLLGDEGWKESSSKMNETGPCHAVLAPNGETVHILPYCIYKYASYCNAAELLPSDLL